MLALSFRHQARVLHQIIRQSGSFSSPADHERWSHLDDEEKARVERIRKLKKWRAPMAENDSYLQAFNISDSKRNLFQNRATTKWSDWVEWYKKQQIEYMRWNQRFIQDRHDALGSDLALATFIVYRDGKIRKKGSDMYITKEDIPDLPTTFDPTWFLEEVDASGTDLCYEGIQNFVDMGRLKIAAFRNCPNFDDFCLEKVLALCPNLQVLDVSGNKNITERGLEGVYRAWNLKKLIVTDWGYGSSFELTCLMLEESMPGLEVDVKRTSLESAELRVEPSLLEGSSIKQEDQVVK